MSLSRCFIRRNAQNSLAGRNANSRAWRTVVQAQSAVHYLARSYEIGPSFANRRLCHRTCAASELRNKSKTKRKCSHRSRPLAGQRWPRKSAQDAKWSFCLTAGTLCAANQERP